MPKLPLVILDLDGTLVDSQHVIVQMMTVAAVQTGLPVPSDDAVKSIIGLSLDHAIYELFPMAEGSKLPDVVEAYRTEALRVRAQPNDPEILFDGARDFVSLLRQSGYLLGIATGKARRGVDHFCKKYEMVGWFDTIQTPDTNPGKPHPGMIESALSETGASIEHAVMVGDTTFDIEMARNAGVFAIGVGWGNHHIPALEQAGADHIVQSMEDLPQVISRILG